MSDANSATPFTSRSSRALRFSLTLLVVLSFVPAAFGVTVNTEFDDAVDFAKFKTFAIREAHLNSKAPALNSDLTKKRIQSDIEHAFTEKGLSIAAGQADLNVSFEFGSVRNMATKAYPAGWRGMQTHVVKTPESAGTLVIDLHDSSTNALVWRGVATEAEPNPMKLADQLEAMVKKSVAKYPPKTSKVKR